MKNKGKTLSVFNTSIKKDALNSSDGIGSVVVSGSGSAGLSSYLPISEWNKAFEIRVDEEGEYYLFGKLPFALQSGITMYVDGKDLDLPSIYDGLPIDSSTIYWEETVHEDGTVSKILKTKGYATIGSLENVGEWADAIPENDRVMVQKAGSNLWQGLDVSEIGSASFENISVTGTGNAFTSFTTSDDKKNLILVKGNTFLTLGGDAQTVTGKKDFTSGGLFVNGNQIVYDGSWKLEGDLIVNGTIKASDGSGVVMFRDAVPDASEMEENVLYVIG